MAELMKKPFHSDKVHFRIKNEISLLSPLLVWVYPLFHFFIIYMRIHIYTYSYICVYIYILIHIYAYTYICRYINIHMPLYVY